MKPDIRIHGRRFYTIIAHTRKGQRFMRQVEGTRDGMAMCDDSRLTQAIADSAIKHSLCVEVNGVQYVAQ